MQLSKMKNIIVLKGMASNVVEEAIVVLKPHVKLKQSEYNRKGKQPLEEKNKRMVVVKEAEKTIQTYVKRLQSESQLQEMNQLKKKYKLLQICNIGLILTIVVAATIAF